MGCCLPVAIYLLTNSFNESAVAWLAILVPQWLLLQGLTWYHMAIAVRRKSKGLQYTPRMRLFQRAFFRGYVYSPLVLVVVYAFFVVLPTQIS